MTFSYNTEPQMPKYAMVQSNIIILDYIHGIIVTKTESREFPYKLFVTYRYPDGSKEVGVLEMPSKDAADQACIKIGGQLGAL